MGTYAKCNPIFTLIEGKHKRESFVNAWACAFPQCEPTLTQSHTISFVLIDIINLNLKKLLILEKNQFSKRIALILFNITLLCRDLVGPATMVPHDVHRHSGWGQGFYIRGFDDRIRIKLSRSVRIKQMGQPISWSKWGAWDPGTSVPSMVQFRSFPC